MPAGTPLDARRTTAPKLPSACAPFNGTMSSSPPTPPTFPVFAFPPSNAGLHRPVSSDQSAAISPASPLSPGGTSVGPTALAALAGVSRPTPCAPTRATTTAGKPAAIPTATAPSAVDDTFEWLDSILSSAPLSECQPTAPFPSPFPAPFPTPAAPSCGTPTTRVSWSAHSIHSAAAMPSARPGPHSSTAEPLALQQWPPLRSHERDQQQQQLNAQRRLPRFQHFAQACAGQHSTTPVSTNTPYFTPVLQSGLTNDMNHFSIAPSGPRAGATRDLNASAPHNMAVDNASPDTPYYTPEAAMSQFDAVDMCGVMSDDDDDDDGWGWFVQG